MNKSYIVAGTFLVLIGGISIGSLIVKDREFSPNENRYLSKAPKCSVGRVLSGEFQEDLESYLNDQIMGRDQWITIKTAIQKTCKDTDIGGAYVGKDGYDFEKIIPEDIDEKLVKRNIKSVSEFFEAAQEESGIAKEHIDFLLVPTSGLIMKEKLPKNAILFDQESYIDRVKDALPREQFIDARETLKKHTDEEIYYRTDHHWTTQGAYLVMQQWCKETGHTFLGKDAYAYEEVTDKFRGSLYSKILDHDSVYDSIGRMEIKGDTDYEVIADGIDIGGIYQDDKLEEKDKYAYFFGGNYGEVAITPKDKEKNKKESKGTLLVVKDSFANAFVPMIADQYDAVYMVDLRFFNKNMQEYMQEKKITDVLVLYNISNFVTDRNLYKLTKGGSM